MFIPKYIKNASFEGKKLTLDDLIVEYKKDAFDLELIESFINKGAYASLLLYLNNNSIVESINGKSLNEEEYVTFLSECRDKLKESVYKVQAHGDFKPLCNIDGLEILENENYIARGKNTLLIEDFRENTLAGLPDEVITLIDYFKENSSTKDLYFEVLNQLSELEWNNSISTEDYNRALKIVNSIMHDARNSVTEEADTSGTQVDDIASKIDQDMNLRVILPPKKKIYAESLFNVRFNHGYKGFRLTERKTYERGNYILINEYGTIKAINRRKLKEYASKYDKYGNIIFSREQADKMMPKICEVLNKKFSDYDYDFSYRIEGIDSDDFYNIIKIYDRNEIFDYTDANFDKIESILKSYIGKEVYLEPEDKVIMNIAGCYVVD